MAQDTTNVSISGRDIPLSTLIRQLETKTGYSFIYAKPTFNDQEKVSLTISNAKFSQVLAEIFQGKNVTWQFRDNSVIFRRKSAASSSSSSGVNADTIPKLTVTGMVVDLRGNPIQGATVSVQGQSRGQGTDSRGQFSFSGISASATLNITSIGYATRQFRINGQREVRIILDTLIQEIQGVEIVSTGYQDIPKERATGSFEQIDNKLLNRSVSTNVLDRLKGIVPGLNIENRTRTGGAAIMIRGISTINANASPLIVVDGFPYNESTGANNLVDNINPNDIESITVLKDAAAASIWGARSGNGVIVITTKRGRYNQKMRIQLNSNVNFIDKPNIYYSKFMSTEDAIDFEKTLFNTGRYNVYDDQYIAQNNFPVLPQATEILLARRKGTLSQARADEMLTALQLSDVRKDIDRYLLQTGINQQYSLNFSGGLQNFNYYGSIGYDNNRGNTVRDNNDRITIRYENTYRPVPNLEINGYIAYTQSKNLDNGFAYQGLLTRSPYTKLADENGNALSVPFPNGLRMAYTDTLNSSGYLNWQFKPLDELRLNDKQSALTDNRIGASVRYTFLKGFKGEIKYQYQKGITNGNNLMSQDSYFVRDMINLFRQKNTDGSFNYPVPLGNVLDKNLLEQISKNVRGQLNYNYTDGSHDLTIIAGAEAREVRTDYSAYRSYGYDPGNGIVAANVDFITFFPLNPSGASSSNINNINEAGYTVNRYVSYFSNMGYTFKKRYTASLSGRIDGSNFFGLKANQRQTPLWSAGAMWNITNENFYHLKWLPFLQLRSTYGFNGNTYNSVTAYPTITYFPSSAANFTNYAVVSSPGNPQIRWEKIAVLNIGVDFGLTGDRLRGSMEYYRKKGIDLIGTILADPTTGFGSYTGNRASIKGNGLDISLNSINTKGALQWSTNFIFSYNTDKVTKYESTLKTGSQYLSGQPFVGKPLYSVFSYRWAGLNPTNGDPRVFLSDTITTFSTAFTSVKSEDLKYIGSAMPRFFGSLRNNLSFRNLTLSFNILYKFDYYIRKSSINYSNLISSQTGHPDYAMRWKKSGDEAVTNVPSATLTVNSQREFVYQNSDILVIKGDHIRLQDIRIGYDIDRSTFRKLPFNNVQLYLYANNLGIIWKANHDGIDPDFGDTTIPPSKSLAVGFNIGF